MQAESLSSLLEKVTRDPDDLSTWMEVAKIGRRVPDPLPRLPPKTFAALVFVVLANPQERALGEFLLRLLELEPVASERDQLPVEWAVSERVTLAGEAWVDRQSGLPILARRLRDGAVMSLIGRVSAGGFAYLDVAPVRAPAYARFLEQTGTPGTPPWTTPETPWSEARQWPELYATCVTKEEARAYARWVGGILPGTRLWFEGAMTHCARIWDKLDEIPRPVPYHFPHDFMAEWPLKPRRDHSPRSPSALELRASVLAGPAPSGAYGSVNTGTWGAIHEWTDEECEWPGVGGYSDNWLWIEESNRDQALAEARSAPRATVVILRDQRFSSLGPSFTGANPGDHDPLLGFRVALWIGAGEIQRVERVWEFHENPDDKARREYREAQEAEERARREAPPEPLTWKDTLLVLGFLLFLAALLFGPLLLRYWWWGT